MNTYAYARVSAKDQNLERQLAAFHSFGIEKNRKNLQTLPKKFLPKKGSTARL